MVNGIKIRRFERFARTCQAEAFLNRHYPMPVVESRMLPLATPAPELSRPGAAGAGLRTARGGHCGHQLAGLAGQRVRQTMTTNAVPYMTNA